MIQSRCPCGCVLRALQTLGEGALILDCRAGFISGGAMPEDVYLIGVRAAEPPSPYFDKITLVIAQRCVDYCTVQPLNLSGYDPRLSLVDVTGDNIEDIYVRVFSGGSGGYTFYDIFRYTGCRLEQIFDWESFNASSEYTVTYRDQYFVEVRSTATGQSWIISLRCRDRDYLCAIYHADGTLKAPIEGWVGPLGGLQPQLSYNGPWYDLVATQPIAGQYNADRLGYVVTRLTWQEGVFTVAYVQVTSGEGCAAPDWQPNPCMLGGNPLPAPVSTSKRGRRPPTAPPKG